MATAVSRRVFVNDQLGEVDALLLEAAQPSAVMAMAHGAGAGMTHPFLEDLCQVLANRGITTLRYQFPYMQAGRRAPDRPPALQATVAAALQLAQEEASGLPVVGGGKSMGGRMTSMILAQRHDLDIAGLVFFGFPLHPAGKPGTERARHLARVRPPMLFLQGTRDVLADLDLLRPVVRELGARATLHVVDGGDHSFAVLKRSGRSRDDVLEQLAATAVGWISSH